MDSNFVDLDILLTQIREPRSRTYFLDAVRAYKAGALRAALSATWVAVVYDLISKYRELAASDDAAATAFLKTFDSATANRNVNKLLEIEAKIISHATTEIQILNQIGKIHLERLREDRHLCAHPTFSSEAELFEPSPEMVRLHLVNAIDLVLSQTPLQGKTIFEQFDVDVQSTGFPRDRLKIQEYVDQRYLIRTRHQNITNFGIVLAKSLLMDIPPQWEGYRRKIVESLITIRERAPSDWPELSTAILGILNSLKPENRVRGIAFVAAFPDFWSLLNVPTQTAFLETATNTRADDLTDYRLLAGITLTELEQPIKDLIAALSVDQLRDALSLEALPELWNRALECYEDSSSFRNSESNFQNFILPFSSKISAEQFDSLLVAITNNGQNWHAADTPQLLSHLLRNTPEEQFPTFQGRNEFHSQLHHWGSDTANLYANVFKLFRVGEWMPPDLPERA